MEWFRPAPERMLLAMDMAGQCDLRATIRQLPGDGGAILQLQDFFTSHSRRRSGPQKEPVVEANDLKGLRLESLRLRDGAAILNFGSNRARTELLFRWRSRSLSFWDKLRRNENQTRCGLWGWNRARDHDYREGQTEIDEIQYPAAVRISRHFRDSVHDLGCRNSSFAGVPKNRPDRDGERTRPLITVRIQDG